MIRATTLALAISLLAAGVTPAAASAQGDTAAARIAEIPGTGLTVRLPARWRFWSPPAGETAVVIATDVQAGHSCELALVEGAGSIEAAANQALDSLGEHPEYVVTGPSFLTVPAGDAVRVSYRLSSAPDDERFVVNEHYVAGPDGIASVVCSSDDPPPDRWRSLVASLEVSGSDDTPGLPFDPRIEVPDHGFAVRFGPEWLVRPWPGPGPLLGGAAETGQQPPQGAMSVLRAVTAGGGPANGECWVEDATDVPALPDAALPDAWQAALVASAEAAGQATSTPRVTRVPWLADHAIRTDWQRWRGTPATAWVFHDGGRRIALLCRAFGEPPGDGWRSIAETVELLPAGT